MRYSYKTPKSLEKSLETIPSDLVIFKKNLLRLSCRSLTYCTNGMPGIQPLKCAGLPSRNSIVHCIASGQEFIDEQ